jgi:hypothetical protein
MSPRRHGDAFARLILKIFHPMYFFLRGNAYI